MSDEKPPSLAATPLLLERPVMIFDGACAFCRYWIARWQEATGSRVDFRTAQEAAASFPGIPKEEFGRAVQFVEPDGNRTSGVEAIRRMARYARWFSGTRLAGAVAAGAPVVAGWAYRFIARHRTGFSFLTRLFFGKNPAPARYLISRSLFLRLLGVVYALAFASLGTQILGLAGRRGISPAEDFLSAVRQQVGPERYRLFPTVFWFGASDQALVDVCVAGVVLGCALAIGLWPVACLVALWVLYLSLVTVGRDFLGFQWDALLLEAGFISIFAAPLQFWPNWKTEKTGERLARWLLLWLLFRLTFESGVVKLVSGDPTWKNLTALEYHYETQPLPLWTAWYANQAPDWFQKASCFMVLAIELAAPFCIFGPRNIRRAGALVMMGLQTLIAATGNYAFFNLLAVALYLLLLDDDFWPAPLARRFQDPGKKRSGWPRWLVAPVGTGQFLLTTMLLLDLFRVRLPGTGSVRGMARTLAPFSLANRYGLFAVMTTTRPEIIVEGSMDGQTWTPYQFKYKVGDLNTRPKLAAPFQPRLDWQMWFAALGPFDPNSWFGSFAVRLLEGSPDVLNLLAANPFPDAPPKYLRATVYQYHFTRFADKSGAWWTRTYDQPFCPPLSLKAEPGE